MKIMHFLRLFLVFLYKNWLFLWFYWFSISIIFSGCSVLLGIYLSTSYKESTTPKTISEFRNNEYLKSYYPANSEDSLFYAPTSSKIDELMENIRLELQLPIEILKPLNSTKDVNTYLENNCPTFCFAVSFENVPNDESSSSSSSSGLDIGKSLKYSISSNMMRLSPRKRYVNDEGIVTPQEHDEYMRVGFLTLQQLIDTNYLRMQSKTDNDAQNYEFEIGSMPFLGSDVIDSQRVVTFGSIYSILFNVLLLSTFLVPLVEEKQNGLKEFLVVATPLNFLNGVAFFVLRFAVYFLYLVVAISMAVIWKAIGIIPFIYVFILLLLYTLSAMSYAYLLSVFFTSVFYAKVGGLLMLVVPYIFYLNSGELSTLASYFLSTKTFMDGVQIFQIFTNKHRNFDFSYLTTNIINSSHTMLSIYLLLISQIFIYSVLYNYLSCIFPGPGGLKKDIFFCLKPSFYKKRQRNQYKTGEKGTDAIIIQDLSKEFKTPSRIIKIADHLNMSIKSKQITVLLGHNGAGKTTTMNMIMGSVPKDAGKIVVCSERDVASYRHLIGFCPQHSVFMPYMTCRQHLHFFAELRGISRKDAHLLTTDLLQQLNLMEKEDEYGKNLSGGMRRRLSLGIALAGETKVIILDEPSSGLDIESRRELWDILLKLRQRKAVLVTTHHMEEAEILGDMICILSNGRLIRTGSPLDLKRNYGSGYILKLCTDPENYKQEETMDLLNEIIPSARVLNKVPPTVNISLPYNEEPKYSELLAKLEEKQTEFGISSISVTDTSLEDVFLNSARDNMDEVDCIASVKETIPYKSMTEPPRISFIRQMLAVFYKKLVYLYGERSYVLFMFCLPFLAVGLATLLMRLLGQEPVESSLPLNLNIVDKGIIYLYKNPEQNEFSRRLQSVLTKEIEDYGVELKMLEMHGRDSMAEELISLQEDNLADFLEYAIGAIEIIGNDVYSGGVKISAYFSANIYHSSAVLVNLVNNAVLKAKLGDGFKIEASYKPIRRFISDVSPTRLEYYAVIVPIGFFFYMFFYVSLPFKEYVSGFKNLQTVPTLRYWTSVLLFDLFTHFVLCCLLYLFQTCMMPAELYSYKDQLTIILSAFFYGFSYLPILYAFANCCQSISAISTYLLSLLIVSAIIPLITSGNMQSMLDYETTISMMRIVPDFNLNHQLRIINENLILNRKRIFPSNSNQSAKALKAFEVLRTSKFYAYALLLFIISWLIFVFFIENKEKRQAVSRVFSCYQCRSTTSGARTSAEEQQSLVSKEKTRVDDILKSGEEAKNYPLLVDDLIKIYDRKAAVRGVSFAVNKQECFGLLGVNGAGKTTTFQMITANSTITGGTAKIDGIDILENEVEYRYRFGYCPQYDCLNNFMTAREILRYMAQLRGVECASINGEIAYWLKELDLQKYADVRIRHYSGGTKRKLNAALAMIGSPPLVLLDEPTTGVDPVSRRFLWKCVQNFQQSERAVVLTSHSMDECEQLCNRLAIMSDGTFKCLGYVPELKRLFGSGFTIKIKLSSLNENEEIDREHVVSKKLNQRFPNMTLREQHADMLTYFINEQHIVWSKVFKNLDEFVKSCGNLIEEYSVNESSLEDIFLKFDTRKGNESV